MAEFSAKDVQALRQATGAGMMDAKRALQETDGEPEAAARWLRENGLAKVASRSGRAADQGAVAVASNATTAAAVELRSETDYVAKSTEFKGLAQDLADAAVAGDDVAVAALQPRIDDLRVSLKENIEVGRVVRFEGPADAVVDTYLHVQNDRGVSAVLVELEGGDRALAHEVALHVAAMRPLWLSRADVPPERVDDERQLLTALTRKEGKPSQALDKIVEGRLNGFFKDVTLLEQQYVRDNKRTVAQLLGDARVTRFARVEIGA